MSFNISQIGTIAGNIASALGGLSTTQIASISTTLSSALGNSNQSKEDALLVQVAALAAAGQTAEVGAVVDQIIGLGVSTNVALILSAAKTAPAASVGAIMLSAKNLIDSGA